MAELRSKFKEEGIKPKQTMWALRAAVTGRTHGADLASVLQIIGKDTAKYRINKAIN